MLDCVGARLPLAEPRVWAASRLERAFAFFVLVQDTPECSLTRRSH